MCINLSVSISWCCSDRMENGFIPGETEISSDSPNKVVMELALLVIKATD